MNPNDAYKNKIGERLTRILLDALEKQEITEDEASEISTYILDNINKAKDNTALFDFLTNISTMWPIFSKVLAAEQEEKLNVKKEERGKTARKIAARISIAARKDYFGR